PLRHLQTPRPLHALPRPRPSPRPGRRQPHHLVVRALPGLTASAAPAAGRLEEVLDEAAAGGLLFVAGGGPEGHRVGLFGFDDRVEATAAEGAEALLAGADEGCGETTAPLRRVDGE